MNDRDLLPVTARLGDADPVPGLGPALDGTGPALLLLPAGPEGDRLRERLQDAVDAGVPADTAVVVATSGSAGEPKGVRLGTAELEYSATATHSYLGGPGQWLLGVPPARVAGLQILVRSRLAGTKPEILDPGAGRFGPEAFAAAAGRLDPGGRRYTALVPTQLHRLIEAGVRLDAFDAILLGGAAAPTALVMRATMAGTRIVRTYGMTETCGGCVYDGRPLPGVRVEVVDALIRIGGPVLARGYLEPPGGTGFTDGWFVTSDTGRLDGAATGATIVTVVGRADEVIVTGGSNVAAQGVEASLAEHPGVDAVAVAGRPDEEWGEIVVAVVVPRQGARPDPAELRAHVGDRLGWPYAPREIVFATELPLLGSGKLDRAAVRRLVAAPPKT
jgi:O-succinylbenzoic acid--CoA ligase